MKEIKKPGFMREASVRPGHPWILEIFICMGIYLAGSFFVGVGQAPGMMVYMLQNRDYIEMLRTGEVDMELVMRLAQNMPEWFTVFALFTQVFLILAFMVYCRFMERRKIFTMGFSGEGAVRQYMKGILVGITAFTAAYLLCLMTGSVRFGGLAQKAVSVYIPLYFCGYMIQGMAEEVICRGFLLVSLSRKYSVWFSAVMSSLFFMSMHFGNPGLTWIGMANLFLFGMFMAFLFVESSNIWVVGAVHAIWNFCQGNVFGVQVSGMAQQKSLFATSFAEGWDVIHGGSFGMEGGLAVTVVLVLGIRLVYGRMRKKDMLEETMPEGAETTQIGSEPPSAEQSAVTADAAGDGGENVDIRVYRNDPDVFTETPWRPDTAQMEEQSGRTVTVFDASYFRLDDEE